MIRKIVTALILIPLAFAIVLFAVSNRAAVRLAFDPIAADPPMFSASLPLFLLLLAALIAGVVVGGAATWSAQRKWRRRARRLSVDVKAAHAEAAALRRQLEAAQNVTHGAPPQTSIASIAYRHPTAA